MGFWEAFGFALYHAIKETKEEERKAREESDRWNQIYDAEHEFQAFYKALGFSSLYYYADYDASEESQYAVDSEIRKMENYREKLLDYIELGGKPELMDDLDEIDEYIMKVKYLSNVGYLGRQDEYISLH